MIASQRQFTDAIEGFSIEEIGVPSLAIADHLIYAIGYEARSTHIVRNHWNPERPSIGVAFASRHLQAYGRNYQTAEIMKSIIHEFDDAQFRRWILDFPTIVGAGRSVAIDISSFTRNRIGLLIRAGLDWALNDAQRWVGFYYAPAAFEMDERRRTGAASMIGAAELLEGYEGGYVDTDRSVTAIVGLGYEPDRALGAIELLEAPLATLFLPTGVDERYDKEVNRANSGLLLKRGRIALLSYDVMRPLPLYEELVRVMAGVQRSGRSVIIPLGPKIFAVAACLASLTLPTNPPLWRVTGGEEEPAHDAEARGLVCGLSISRMDFPISSTGDLT